MLGRNIDTSMERNLSKSLAPYYCFSKWVRLCGHLNIIYQKVDELLILCVIELKMKDFLRLNPSIHHFEIWLRKILCESNGQNRHTREKLMNVPTEREHFILPE